MVTVEKLESCTVVESSCSERAGKCHEFIPYDLGRTRVCWLNAKKARMQVLQFSQRSFQLPLPLTAMPRIVLGVFERMTRPPTTAQVQSLIPVRSSTLDDQEIVPFFKRYIERGGSTFSKNRSRRAGSLQATRRPPQTCTCGSSPTVVLQSILPQQPLQFPRDFIDLVPPFERRINGLGRRAGIHGDQTVFVKTATRCRHLLLQ